MKLLNKLDRNVQFLSWQTFGIILCLATFYFLSCFQISIVEKPLYSWMAYTRILTLLSYMCFKRQNIIFISNDKVIKSPRGGIICFSASHGSMKNQKYVCLVLWYLSSSSLILEERRCWGSVYYLSASWAFHTGFVARTVYSPDRFLRWCWSFLRQNCCRGVWLRVL